MSIGIIAHGRYVPKKILDNKFFINNPNNPYKVYIGEDEHGNPKFADERVLLDEKKILDNTGGIRERRCAAENEKCVDLVEKAFVKSGFPAEDLGGIIIGTISNERRFPSLACQTQERIGAVNVTYAVDLAAACSGFVHALDLACYKAKRLNGPVLTAGIEILTRIADYEEINCDLFGDGCGLVVVGETKDLYKRIIGTHFESDVSGISSIYYDKTGKLRMPSERYGEGGRDVMKKATRGMVDVAHKLLKKTGCEKEDISLYIPHQANGRIVEAIRKRISPNKDNVYQNIEFYGNMSSATVPFALSEAIENERIKEGDLVMLLSAGAGLALGGALIRI